MTAHVPRLPFSLDPLMAEAKRRATQRRVIFSAAVLVAVALGLALFFALNGGSGGGSGQSSGAAKVHSVGQQGGAGASMTIRPAHFVIGGFGGIRKPPGGADLRHKHRLFAQGTAAGPAAIWVAPDWAVRGNCAWLTIGGAVYGGECRRSVPPRRGLSEVVPLHIGVHGHPVTLLWGNVGSDVANLNVRFRDGTSTRVPLSSGVFLHVFPKYRWRPGLRPAWLVAHTNDGFAFRQQLKSNSMFLR